MLASRKNFVLTARSQNNIQTCLCPDDKFSHLYSVRAISFGTDVKLTVKATTLEDYSICMNHTDAIHDLDVGYSDSETRTILVEVF